MKASIIALAILATCTYSGTVDAEMSDKGTAVLPMPASGTVELHFSLTRHQGASIFANVEKAAMHDKLAVLQCLVTGDSIPPTLSQGQRCGIYLGDSREATYTLLIVNQDNVDHTVTLSWKKVAAR
jgi:hypothetical protein